MTTWADAHRSAAVMAAEVHGDLDIDLTTPVDVFGAIKTLGVILAFAPLEESSGAYVPGSPAGIILHEGHPRTRQRYTAGHELGHHVFKHEALEVDGDLEFSLQRGGGRGWSAHEKEAEAFGAWFLMPRRLMQSGLTHLGLDRPQDAFDVYALSLWLGTSYTATARQLATTRLVSEEIVDEWAKIPPRTLKQTLAGELTPNDLRNDMWRLDAHDHQHPVEVRPGDRMILELDEIPSSGYSWRFTSLPESVRLVADSYEHEFERGVDLGALPLEQPPPPVEGAEHPRTFMLEVDREAEARVDHLALAKDRPWEHGEVTGEFELLLSIKPPLHGVQVPEAELALEHPGGLDD